MKGKSKVLHQIAKATDLYGEILPGETFLELLGDTRVLIEKHCGVTEYTRQRIQIKSQSGYLCLLGSGLELNKMSEQQLIVTGSIEQIYITKGV